LVLNRLLHVDVLWLTVVVLDVDGSDSRLAVWNGGCFWAHEVLFELLLWLLAHSDEADVDSLPEQVDEGRQGVYNEDDSAYSS